MEHANRNVLKGYEWLDLANRSRVTGGIEASSPHHCLLPGRPWGPAIAARRRRRKGDNAID